MSGKSLDMRPRLLREMRRLTCLRCLGHSIAESTKDLRSHLFLKKKGKIFSAATSMRKCSFYQADIWRKCLTSSPALPDQQSCGWLVEKHVLHNMWMSGLPTPEAVLKLTACKWTKGCTTSSCQCMKNKLKCTRACSLEHLSVVETRFRRLKSVTEMMSMNRLGFGHYILA